MDDDGHVVVIEQPDGAMLASPFRVARNGGAGRVRSNAEVSKSASAPVRSEKFKKWRVAPEKYVRPKEWKIVSKYKTCYDARLDDEHIKIDMYQQACALMELSSHRMVPGQDEAPNGMHLWTFKGQANAASNGVIIREFQCPLRSIRNCRVCVRTVEGIGYIQLERRRLHNINSHIGAIKEPNDEEPQELEEGSDDDDDVDSEDDEDSEDEGDGDDAIFADDGL